MIHSKKNFLPGHDMPSFLHWEGVILTLL